MNDLWWFAFLVPFAVAVYCALRGNLFLALLAVVVTVVSVFTVAIADMQDLQEQSEARADKRMSDIAAVYEAIEAKYDIDVAGHGWPGATYETWVINGADKTCRLGTDDLEANQKNPVLTCVVDDEELPVASSDPKWERPTLPNR